MIAVLLLSATLAGPPSSAAARQAALAAFHRAEARIAAFRAADTSGLTAPQVTSYGSQPLGHALVTTFATQDRDGNHGTLQYYAFAPYRAVWSGRATHERQIHTTYVASAWASFCGDVISSLVLVPYEPQEPCSSGWKAKVEWSEPQVLIEWYGTGCGLP